MQRPLAEALSTSHRVREWTSQSERLLRRYLRPPAAHRDATLPQLTELEPHVDVATYWRDRLLSHTTDMYASVGIEKFPEDLRVYEHLLWAGRYNVVIELGSRAGGSALWFRDRLTTLTHYRRIRSPRVICVDLVADRTEESVRSVDPDARGIRFLKADLRDPDLPLKVGSHVRVKDRVLVIEDSAHEFDTTWAALEGFSAFVPQGGVFVVEDTCVDREELRADAGWPRGVVPAVEKWLTTPRGGAFRIDRSVELYGLTGHPSGFLRRWR